jgi:cellulose biosynthesis protein BcsQ
VNLRDEMFKAHEQHGKLTPVLLVEVATETPGSELHRHLFVDFDDEKAAEVGRLHRAHKLIQKYKVIDNRSPGEQGPRDVRERIRAFSAIPSVEDPSQYEYHPTQDIVADPVARATLLREAERAWKALKARYGYLQEFVNMVQDDLGGEAS